MRAAMESLEQLQSGDNFEPTSVGSTSRTKERQLNMIVVGCVFSLCTKSLRTFQLVITGDRQLDRAILDVLNDIA
jgi:hypothetical protein